MKRIRKTILWLLTGPFGLMAAPALSQTGFTVNIKKPEQYEKRVLKAEKTKEGKLKEPKHFFQNLTTHYNYYFNANNKLQEVIARAKEAAHDDYTSLLPFYNYSLDVTAADKTQLDSVIYKTQTGVVLHDLRNDWNDDLYLLWGAAYFLQKKFDSAALMFQFINYSYADKEKDGYYRYIGSNLNDNKELTIATKEATGFPQKLLSRPPSRNTAFLWQIKTLIEAGNFEQSGSLITTLKADPQFPERLQDDLEEVQAYWFYKQKIWDSSATHLLNALDVAANKLERSRWEFLAAQMYEQSGHTAEAQQWFEKTVAHTPDPVMEIYARLNLIRINKSGGDNYIDQNIAALLKMARKDKYEDYRDIIYFMAARMETERGNLTAAQELMLKGARYVGNDPAARTKAFLLIADMAYGEKKYGLAAGFYDSVQLASLAAKDTARVFSRKRLLATIVGYTATVSRQDSLQRIAAMPEGERAVYISRLVKRLRKEQGLKEEAATITSGTALVAKNVSADLFANTAKGEWYFYNTGSKTQGLAQFKQVWGSRPNVDNWRRFADVNKQLLVVAPNNTRAPATQVSTGGDFDNTPTFNTLLSNLPLTQTAIKSSNDSIRNALYGLGNVYLNDAEDYTSAIATFEELRKRFPDDVKMDEVLFDLYYMNTKSGNSAGAAEIRTALQQRFPGSRFTAIVSTGKDPDVRKALAEKATRDYETIYDLYLAGRFSEAEAAKKAADSLYKTTYWQPQLLYIDAVYHIKQREDSVAKTILATLIGQNPASAIGSKAQTLLEVLNRRAQIEDELAKLQIERPAEDDYNPPKQAVTQISPPVSVIHAPPVIDTAVAVKRPEVSAEAPPKSPELKKQTSLEGPVRGNNGKPAVKVPVKAAEKAPLVTGKPVAAYTYDAGARHYSIIILNKVDPVFANEARNAFNRYNREKYPAQPLQITVVDLDADHRLLLTGVFDNAVSAIDYTQKTARVASNEVVPWLKSDKFSFSILSETNLELLKEKKDLEAYKKFVEVSVPAKW